MASNLVLTPVTGSAVTFHASHANATASVPTGQGKVWQAFSVARLSPWELVAYAGYGGVDAKFFGRRPIRYSVSGYVFSDDATESKLQAERDAILALNATQTSYGTTGPFTLGGTSGGVIVEEVQFDDLGAGTGPRHTFVMTLLVLAGT